MALLHRSSHFCSTENSSGAFATTARTALTAIGASIVIGLSLAAPVAAATSADYVADNLQLPAERLQAINDRIANAAAAKRAQAKRLQGDADVSKFDSLLMSMMEKASPDSKLAVIVQYRDAEAMPKARGKSAMGLVEGISPLRNQITMTASPAELSNLSKAAGVKAIRGYMPEAEMSRRGSVVTEGDALLKVKAAREQFGVDGKGVSVCVISDGVSNRAKAQASGDLPADVEVCTQNPGSGDEGTAMLEIVHDLAPAAKLSFCSASGLALFDAISWSATKANGGKGCDVIVDDIGLLLEPRFQISDESELINRISKQGVTYVSSAGNDANNNYRLPYRDADPFGNGPNKGFHDFGKAAGKESSIGFPVFVVPGGRSAIFLHWSEAFGKARNDFVMEGVLQGGAPLDSPNSPFTLDFVSDEPQSGSGDPVEALVVTNKTQEVQSFFVLVKRKSGNDFVELSMVNNGNLGSIFGLNFRTADKSIFGHSGAAGAISVAAVDAANPGLADIERFSSRGLVFTYFDNPGNRRFDLQLKPDVTGVDGVAVTGAGGFPSRFFGTSASAPHVAGIAALALNRNARTDVQTLLHFTSDDRGTPGFDTAWGFGLVNTQKAVSLAPYIRSFKSSASDVDRGQARANLDAQIRDLVREQAGSATKAGERDTR